MNLLRLSIVEYMLFRINARRVPAFGQRWELFNLRREVRRVQNCN